MSNQLPDDPTPAPSANDASLIGAPTGNYFARHWRGELSLARSFWLNVIAVNVSVNLIWTGLLQNVRLTSIIGSAVYIIGYWSFALLLAIWQFVGVWIAAKIYFLRGGDKGNALLARLFVIIFACMSAVRLYQTVVPQVTAAFAMVSGDDAVENYQVTVLPSGKEIEFKGGLKLGAAKRVKQVLDAAPYVTTFRLETRGGRVGEAIEIARLIKQRRLDIYVPERCVSAGTILLLAGNERIIAQSAKIGFHTMSFPGMAASETNTIYEEILQKSGASQAFIKRALDTPAKDMWFPKSDELLREGIITRITDGSEFGIGTAGLAKYDSQTLRRELVEAPMYLALSHAKPDEFTEAVQGMAKEISDGKSVQTAAHHVNSLLLSTAGEMWPTASNQVLEKWLDFMIKLIVDNREIAPREVLMKINDTVESQAWGTEITRKLPNYPIDDEHKLLAILFEGGLVRVDKAKLDTSTTAFQDLFMRTFPDAADRELLLGEIPDSEEMCKNACALNLRLYYAMKTLPDNTRSDAIRSLITSD